MLYDEPRVVNYYFTSPDSERHVYGKNQGYDDAVDLWVHRELPFSGVFDSVTFDCECESCVSLAEEHSRLIDVQIYVDNYLRAKVLNIAKECKRDSSSLVYPVYELMGMQRFCFPRSKIPCTTTNCTEEMNADGYEHKCSNPGTEQWKLIGFKIRFDGTLLMFQDVIPIILRPKKQRYAH
jgi:hypothetical protein